MYHRQSIELWFHLEFFQNYYGEDFLCLLASATLVDFPQFRDIHHLIPLVLELLDKRSPALHTTKLDYHQIEDSDKWEIYLKYRQIVSRFLIDGIPRDSIYDLYFTFNNWSRRGQENYVNLAKRFLNFLSKSEGFQ